MSEQFKKLLLPSIIFAAFFRLHVGIYKFALAQEQLTAVVVAKEVGVSLLMVLAIAVVIALVFSLLLSLLNWMPFSRGFNPPRGLLVSAILITASLPVFFIAPAVLGITNVTDSRTENYGLLMFAVSLASFIVWSLVLVMGIVKRDKNQPQSEHPQTSSVMRSPVLLTGFLTLLCLSVGVTFLSPSASTQTLQGSNQTMQTLDQQALINQTMEKAGYLQDIEGNWQQTRSEPKFLQVVIEIDEPRLRAMGLDFIEVKNKIDKEGTQIVQALMSGRSENLDVDSLVRRVSELRLQAHSKDYIYLRDVAKVYAELTDEEPGKDEPPFSVRLRTH